MKIRNCLAKTKGGFEIEVKLLKAKIKQIKQAFIIVFRG